MADLIEFRVNGMEELRQNLAQFQSDKMLGKAVRTALQFAGRVPLAAAKRNARAEGLAFMGFKKTPGRGDEIRYGRIPRSLKVGRAYKPRGTGGDLFRVNVGARSQRGAGIYKNKAPHAHLIEYGWNYKPPGRKNAVGLIKGGRTRRIEGRPFLGPALRTTAVQTIEAIQASVAKQINDMKFNVDGKP